MLLQGVSASRGAGRRSTLRDLSHTVRFGRRYASRRFANRYDEGKRFEDHTGAFVATLESIVAIDGADVADIGTGTGQVARKLAPRARSVHGFDASSCMVAYARRVCAREVGRANLAFAVASADSVPLPDASIDLVIFPWSMLSIVAPGFPDAWRPLLDRALGEAARIARTTGTVVVAETTSLMGELPWGEVWHPGRRALLEELERHYGFTKTLYANDWDFLSRRNMLRYGELWFKRDTLLDALAEGSTILRECSGLYYARVSDLIGRRATR